MGRRKKPHCLALAADVKGMTMEGPISTHGQVTNLAKHIVSVEHDHWKIPDGTILAPIYKRAAGIYPGCHICNEYSFNIGRTF